MARLYLCLLGTFQATLDGEPLTSFATDKVRALLAYLAVEDGQPHTREKLAGLLWPDHPECQARTNLRSTLARLRKAICDDQATHSCLAITRQTLHFNPDADAWVDATAFTRHLTTADPRAYQPAGTPIPELERAVTLYQGPFLEGFSLRGSAPFEEWALFERERLHRLAMESLHNLVEAYEARGAPGRALRHAWRQLELDPSWESAHCQAMNLLACTGHRQAALAQYAICCQRLADELDVEPSPQTLALYRQIRDNALVPPCPPAPASPRVPTQPAHAPHPLRGSGNQAGLVGPPPSLSSLR